MENDAVWRLVDQHPAPKAGPTFVSDVMREIRLQPETPEPWWKRIWGPVPLTAGTLAAAAAVALMVYLSPDPQTPVAGPQDAGDPALQEATLAELDSNLEEELLITAAEDPSLFSDEELLAMLY
jgi:hypothetical protein